MDADALKKEAAVAAAAEVESGMRLGIGTGSTAAHFVRALGDKVRAGMKLVGVPTSERTAELCRREGVPLTTLDETPELDLAVDGADELDSSLRLIKGGGGALLREKIVASAARRFVVIADRSKLVGTLGAFPLPVEVIPFGLGATRKRIERTAERLGLSGGIALRMAGGAPFQSDGGHHILDASFGRIPDPEALAAALDSIPGVVDHGLFLGMAHSAILAGDGGLQRLMRE
jgi:ribose 5-phosphate isomerase A